MATGTSFTGKKLSAEVRKNKRGLHCVIARGEGAGKHGVALLGCRSGEDGKKKSIEIAKKVASSGKV